MSFDSPERDQALLNALAIQVVRAPIPMILVAIFVSGLAWGRVNTAYVLSWAACVIGMQALRFIRIRALALDTARPISKRLNDASRLSLVNGIVLASSIGFFTGMDETSRAIYSMIMIGIVAGTIATSHGYRPVFVGLVLPILSAVSLAWLITGGETLSFIQTSAIAVLTAALGLLLYASSRDVYRSFGDSFEARKELEAALESEKTANAAKTRFLAAASHDLRQPLHTMSMLSAALTLRDLDSKSKSIADKMNSAMSDLSGELDSLLDISKLDAGVMRVRPSVISATSLLKKLVDYYQDSATRKNLTIELNIEQSVEIEVDRSLFERVLRNLIDNAIKYTVKGTVTIDCTKSKNNCVITITDTGIGIPHDEQFKIREEFYQLANTERDRQKGLGLGLSIVWRIIPLINATLSMSSEPDVGTRYTLIFPVFESYVIGKRVPESSEKIDLEPLVLALQGKQALVVEDDKDVRFGTRTLLEDCGLSVVEATGTAGARHILENCHVDIALVDLRLPDGDSGLKAIEVMRTQNNELPIIILSGETSPAVLQNAVEANCEFLVKPVQMNDLIKEIHLALFSSVSIIAP